MMITPFYAAILTLIFLVLSLRTIKLRRKYKIAVGHNDNIELLRAIRAHANFAEYVPLALLLIHMLEIGHASRWLVHLLCISLVMGRLLHAYSVSDVNESIKLRVIGMTLTFAALAVSASAILFYLVFGMIR